MTDSARSFIEKHGLDSEKYDFSDMVDKYIAEMTAGLAGISSLKMLPSYIRMNDIKKDEPVCVIDAGGTNLRIAQAVMTDEGFSLPKGTLKTKMFGTEGRISKEDFFDGLAEKCLPYVADGGKVAFSFAFPAVNLPDLDARVIIMDKEVEISDMEGALVGKGLSEALCKKGKKNVSVYVINDSVATCLAGMAERPDGYDTYTGTILGTGNNSCYIEKLSEIKKLEDNDGSMIINMESGAYALSPKNDIDIEFDASLLHPGKQMGEQQVSGAYLGPLVSWTLRQAQKEGALKIDGLSEDVTTPEVDEFLRSKTGMIAEKAKDNIGAAYAITDAVTARGAKFGAVQMAAMVKKTGAKRVCMTVEGSTYYKMYSFKERIDSLLAEYFEKHGISADLIEVEDAVLKGCAIAALMQK